MTPAHWISFAALAFTVFTSTAVLSFMLGRLSQRMTHVEKQTEDHVGMADRLARLEVKMEHVTTSVDKVCRNLENVSHQLSNLSMNQAGKLYEIGASE